MIYNHKLGLIIREQVSAFDKLKSLQVLLAEDQLLFLPHAKETLHKLYCQNMKAEVRNLRLPAVAVRVITMWGGSDRAAARGGSYGKNKPKTMYNVVILYFKRTKNDGNTDAGHHKVN